MTDSTPIPPEKTTIGQTDNQRPSPAVMRLRQLAAATLMVVLCDAALYPNGGFAGFALVFLAAPAFLILGRSGAKLNWGVVICGLLLMGLAARQAWCGMSAANLAGVLILTALAMSLAGLRPYVLEAPLIAFLAVFLGVAGLVETSSKIKLSRPTTKFKWLSVALPLAALVVFGALFVLANPDLASSLDLAIRQALERTEQWLMEFSPDPGQVFLWGVVGLATLGVLSPYVTTIVSGLRKSFHIPAPPAATDPRPAPLYRPVLNMLAAVIGLFAVYLVFEFATLWFREFPEGFYYAGYAHEGAAWLTVALALATVVLSLVFRGPLQRDPRLSALRRLAWIWSFQNMLLALAVYNRLFIYINFNGMTRMRMVGLFGITAVVIGFGLVIWKIARDRSFLWLIQRHLWTLALTITAFIIFPVDAVTTRYNVARILSGDLAPSVQLSVHPLTSEGALQFEPLLKCSDPVIREGIRAMLAERLANLEQAGKNRPRKLKRRRQGWTTFQLADTMLLNQLRSIQGDLATYADANRRVAVLVRFHDYAYQWY